jgi:hypothetical protein
MCAFSGAKYEDFDICLGYLDTFVEKKINDLSNAEVRVMGPLIFGSFSYFLHFSIKFQI